MKISKIRLAAIGFLLFSSIFCSAQPSKYSIGINAGAFVYNGDLSPWRSGSLKTPAFVLGFTGHRTLSSKFAARAELNFGKMRGDDARYLTPTFHQFRALTFETTITEIVAAAEWSPWGSDRKLTPYMFAGVGYAGLTVRRDYSRFSYEYFTGEPEVVDGLRRDTLQTTPGGTVIFPVGFGLKFIVSDKISFHGEAAHRFTRNDYLDGWSLVASPKYKDSYTKYSLGIRLAIDGKDQYDCPAIKY